MREISVQEEQRIVRIAYSGCVTDADMAGGSPDERVGSDGFSILVDLSGVDEFRVSGEAVEKVAKERKPVNDRRCAIVAPTAVAFGLSRMYQSYSGSPNVRVFQEASAALEWLAGRTE